MKSKAGVVIGTVTLAVGLAAAVTTPATEYELSIYTATPIIFWVAVAIAFVIGVWYGLFFDGFWRLAGLTLGSGATLSIVLLPILRGYHYYGFRDALTQLGVVTSILAGHPWPERVIYPLLHLLAASITLVTGLPERVSMVGIITFFAGVYILGSLLLARELADTPQSVSLAVIASWMLLPLMTVRLPALFPIPTTMAVFLTPFVLTILIRSGQQETWQWKLLAPCAVVIALLMHPILATFLVILTAMFWLLSSGLRAVNWQRSAAPLRLETVPALIGLVGVSWLLGFPSRLNSYIISIAGAVNSSPGGDIAEAGSSFGRIGISLFELGIRLAGVKLVFIAITGIPTLILLRQYYRDGLTTTHHLQLVAALSLLPVGGIVLLFLSAGISNMWSRYLGMSMSMIAVLGAIGAVRVEQWASRQSVGRTHIALFLATLILLGGAVATIHPSPNVVRPNQHVTEAQTTAYNHAFEHDADDISGLYTIPRNYRDAYYGSVAAARGIGTEQNWRVHGGSHPPDHYVEWVADEPRGEEPHMVSDMGRATHLELFGGEVQDKDDFEAVEVHYHKLYENGAGTIYY